MHEEFSLPSHPWLASLNRSYIHSAWATDTRRLSNPLFQGDSWLSPSYISDSSPICSKSPAFSSITLLLCYVACGERYRHPQIHRLTCMHVCSCMSKPAKLQWMAHRGPIIMSHHIWMAGVIPSMWGRWYFLMERPSCYAFLSFMDWWPYMKGNHQDQLWHIINQNDRKA